MFSYKKLEKSPSYDCILISDYCTLMRILASNHCIQMPGMTIFKGFI